MPCSEYHLSHFSKKSIRETVDHISKADKDEINTFNTVCITLSAPMQSHLSPCTLSMFSTWHYISYI